MREELGDLRLLQSNGCTSLGSLIEKAVRIIF